MNENPFNILDESFSTIILERLNYIGSEPKFLIDNGSLQITAAAAADGDIG